jgi:hypothetical protein
VGHPGQVGRKVRMLHEVQDQIGLETGRQERGRIVDQGRQGRIDGTGRNLESVPAVAPNPGDLRFTAAVLLKYDNSLGLRD